MAAPAISQVFRLRLQALIDRSGLSQSMFARGVRIDRSTLSQLLSTDSPRLPRADTLAAIAGQCHVSVDWLLGLSQREEIGAEIIGTMLQIEPYARAPVGRRLMIWLHEAEGYRIRSVTEGFPDFLKTEDTIRFEYQGALSGDAANAWEAVAARLALMRRPDSDLEVCAALQAFTTMAHAESKWQGFGVAARRRQLDYMIGLYEELYPRLRVYVYTLTETYSNPFTVFGPKRVALFLGSSYLVLNATEHIRLFNQQFDGLIRLAVVQPHGFGAMLEDLLAEIS